ncbi:MAG: hypothetical protein KDK78_12420, partial [Chlamydiia bacterium]|nr:hypothetical protein [Chlamydiia bacterium]
MMATQSQKTRIQLPDYDFHLDIEDRLLTASLTAAEVEILEELMHSSLVVEEEELEEDFSVAAIRSTLSKLEDCGLLYREDDSVYIDKERRKAFETLTWRFDDTRATLDYVKALLKKVPIHCLPNWYCIPRTSDDIFTALIEHYLEAPKLYERHIQESLAEDPVLQDLYNEASKAPYYCTTAASAMERLGLTPAEYQEKVLLLEFHLAAFGSFRMDQGEWVEVLIPLHEHVCYLTERAERQQSLQGPKEPSPPAPFSFLRELKHTLGILIKGPVPQSKLSPRMRDTLLLAKLATEDAGALHATPKAEDWLSRDLEDCSQSLCNYQRGRYKKASEPSLAFTERDLIDVGKALTDLPPDTWIPVDMFIDQME